MTPELTLEDASWMKYRDEHKDDLTEPVGADIVERLRANCEKIKPCTVGNGHCLYCRAADEIERLRLYIKGLGEYHTGQARI